MPPIAKTIGFLVLIGAGTVCAATPTQPSEHSVSQARQSQSHRSPLERLREELRADTASRAGGVRPAGFDSPVPPADESPVPPSGEKSAGQTGAQPLVEPPERSPNGSRDGGPPIRLNPPSGASRTTSDPRAGRPGGLPSVITVASSLAVVLGLFLIVAWIIRRAAPGGSAPLPGEVFEVLGRAVLANRGQVQLFRCGSKLLLVSVSTTGVETLTEITDPDEVNRLVGLCHQTHPASASATFRQVFEQLAGQRAVPGSGETSPTRQAAKRSGP